MATIGVAASSGHRNDEWYTAIIMDIQAFMDNPERTAVCPQKETVLPA
jgi:hypothetical protein